MSSEINFPTIQRKTSKEYKVSTMADAMDLARQTLRSDYTEDEDPDPYGYAQEIENDLGVDILDPHWKSKPDEARWLKRLRARARRAVVARFYMHGMPVPEIARLANTSEIMIYKDLHDISAEWRKSYLNDIEDLAARDLARLDSYLAYLAPKIEMGDTKAVATAVDIIKERSNILGYRQGVQVDITQYIRQVTASQGFDPDKAESIAQKISIQMK